LLVLGRTVSFQITILKVLAGHPEGRLSVAELSRCVSILISSGPEWTSRTNQLAAQAPALDIFSQLLVVRDSAGWLITEAGRAFLASIEAPFQMVVSVAIPMVALPAPMPNSGSKRRSPRRRRRAARRARNVKAA